MNVALFKQDNCPIVILESQVFLYLFWCYNYINMYRVRLYQDKKGKSPVSDFIFNSSKQEKLKIVKQIKYLEIFGITKANPNLKKLIGTPLWEIRILGKNSIRIICVAIVNGEPESHNEILILNIFKKKSNKTPSKELNLSVSRYKEVVDN